MIGIDPGGSRDSFAPPSSPSRWIRALAWLQDHLEPLPAPLRAAVWGALIIGAMTLVRSVLQLVVVPAARSWSTVASVFIALGVGAYCGAVGGLVHHFVRAPSRRLGRMGDYLTGVAVAYSYFLALCAPAAALGVLPSLRRLDGWPPIIAVGTFFGLLLGHFWFREEPPGSP